MLIVDYLVTLKSLIQNSRTMKKIVVLLWIITCCAAWAGADVVIDGKSYVADTVHRRQVGPGIMNTIVRLPDFPLNVYVLETDLTNPYNRVETTLGYNTVGKTELLTNAVVRNRTATKRPVAACNANFWIVGGSGEPWNVYALGTPNGAAVRNDTTYVNANTSGDQWNGGPSHSGAVAIDRNGKVYAGRWWWYGTVASPKVKEGAPQHFYNVNRRCVAGEMALWNAAYSRTREFENNWVSFYEKGDNQSDNYYLNFAEGEGWRVGKDMAMVVKKIVHGADRLTLGDYDACLTCTGETKETMAALAEGDVVTVNSSWMTNEADRDHEYPLIENMVEGNAPVMHGGQLTGRNYDETYNTMVYSRTAYGTNATGDKLYMIVIDKSTSPRYGTSAGCTTAQMCQIMQSLCPQVWDVVNFDAGGSAEMLVDGAIINTTTEGTPRPVATGWMLEAVGEEDNEVASIAFDDYNVKMPVYSSYQPKILGYNRRGELVSKDVRGFALTCDATLGKTQGESFMAGAAATTGTLTATLGEMTATLQVTLLAAQPAIKVKPTIIIDRRDYPVEVTAMVNGVEYSYDPGALSWTIDHPEVATITGGVLRGIKNGEAHLTCRIGDLVDEADVLVQISDVPYRYEPWTDWTVKASGHKNAVLNSDGTLTFTYGSGRAAYIELDKQLTLYGLPDTVAFSFTSDVPITRVSVDVRNMNFTKTHNQSFAPDSAFAAGTEHRICIDMDEMGGADAVSTYPLTLRSIRFEPEKGLDASQCSIALRPLYCHYQVAMPSTADVNGDGRVDVEDVNAVINIILKQKALTDYDGIADVTGDGRVDVEDVNSIINIILKTN